MRTCENCKYSKTRAGALVCMGQKGMPYVRQDGSCDSWKTMKLTNADRIRAMTDEEIEKWFWWMHKEMMLYTDSRHFLHEWLRQEKRE